MAFTTIDLEADDGVAVLAFNRPQTLNSVNAAMHAELREALDGVRDDSAIRCLLITGRGRAFCAGQDLAERAAGPMPPDLEASLNDNYNPLIRRITALAKPVVCAVNGVAAGAGASIALACDIVLAARSASFIQSFGRVGLVPDSGGSWWLPHLVGRARAMGLAMTGERLSAERAEAWGLIWRCVDDDALADEAMALAKRLAAQPTLGLARTKQAITAAAHNDLDSQLDLEARLQGECGLSDDYREGVSAFIEKREPLFRGR